MTETTRRTIAVITGDTLGQRVAGPALRAMAISSALASTHDVTLATTGSCDRAVKEYRTMHVDAEQAEELAAQSDIVIVQGFVLRGRLFHLPAKVVVIADVYDPLHLAQLVVGQHLADQDSLVAESVRTLDEQLSRADFVLCASETQRSMWLGHMSALGRLTPRTYTADPTLRSLIATVPFGVEPHSPEISGPGPRQTIDGIGDGDKLLIWGGGIYNWFDPLTLLRSVDQLRHQIPDLRLLFMALDHPNPEVPAMKMAADAQLLADELGLTGKHVFFNKDWVPADERHNTLLQADVAVSTHFDSVETHFSFRTRLLDALWCGLPVVTTTGGHLSSLIESRGAGLAVAPLDVEALSLAIQRLLSDSVLAERCSDTSRQLAHELAWATCLAPLVDFCANPSRSADAARVNQSIVGGVAARRVQRVRSAVFGRLAKGFDHLDKQGLGSTIERIVRQGRT